MIKYRSLLLLLIAVFYFSTSWYFPWDLIQFDSSISVSYLFDLIFGFATYTILKQKDYFGRLDKVGTLTRAIAIIIFAFLCVSLALGTKMLAPFRYVDNLFLQILILAPLIEELVFRGSFFLIGEKLNLNPKHLLISNGVLFSISHLPGLWYLESAFHGFIYFQLLYTFGLGWMCAKARLESRGLLEPILLHFLFNSVFYLAVTNNGL